MMWLGLHNGWRIKQRGPERSEGHVCFNLRVGQSGRSQLDCASFWEIHLVEDIVYTIAITAIQPGG
jgi:hypothetical protein